MPLNGGEEGKCRILETFDNAVRRGGDDTQATADLVGGLLVIGVDGNLGFTDRLADLAITEYEMREGEIYQLVIDQIEHALIDRALAKCGGVKTKAADFLGINRNTLNKKVKDLGIETAD